MEDLRARRIRIAELPQRGKPAVTINIKPMVSIIVCIILGIVMIAADFLWYIGAVLIVISLLVLWKTQDYRVFEAYPEFFVVYTRDDHEYCQMARWDEVQEWVYKQGKSTMDSLLVKVSDTEVIAINVYAGTKLVHCFNKFIPDKEAHKLQQANAKSTPFKIKWPWGKK